MHTVHKVKKNFAVLCIVTSLFLTFLSSASVIAESQELTNKQKNAIAMLNYMTVLTQDINKSKNSQLYMEEAYSDLINNTYAPAVDPDTLSQMTGLLDTMEQYRLIDVKRDRLKYVYEQSQAQAMRSIIPNPLGMLSASSSFNLLTLVGSGIYMAVDSYSSYQAYSSKAEQDYLKGEWALDDEASAALHESRKDTFVYMINMVNKYDLPADSVLTEKTVNEFVDWKNNKNVISRIQFLEENKDTYKSYGGYWLTLADSYYEDKDYKDCVNAVEQYEDLGVRIFLRDYDYAKVLPHAIVAAEKAYSTNRYVSLASNWAQKIISNTDNSDWSLRYFAAQTYVDLYKLTSDKSYLEKAYDIAKNNVNELFNEQLTLNATYLDKVKFQDVPKGKTKSEKEKKKKIEEYNDMLKETRKTELPPVYEPLMLNCDLLFALADEIGISKSQKNRYDAMLHPNDDRLFLPQVIDDEYWFYPKDEGVTEDNINISFDGNELEIPASNLTQYSTVTVNVTDESGKKTSYSDWKVESVERKTEGDLSSFTAKYSNDSIKDYKWTPNEDVTIQIKPIDSKDITLDFEYKTSGTKDHWYDYLQFWKGHKNHWYDYAKVWENSVKFVRVK